MTVQLFCGDCLEIMPTLADKTIDAVVCDPPYGTINCSWDSIIPLEIMWIELNKKVKKNGAIAIFCSQPFTSKLIMSNPKMFRYCWVWDKNSAGNILIAKYQPLKFTEDIAIFSKDSHFYLPQFLRGFKDRTMEKPTEKKGDIFSGIKSNSFFKTTTNKPGDARYPSNIIRIEKQASECCNAKAVHPTQKPVELMEYLIKTYTQEGETVLDFTMGSGSTGVACVNLGRNFIGIEKDPQYFEIAKERIAEAERRKNNEFFVKKPDAPTLFDFMLEDKQ
jgi:DNA modification methylase